MALTPSRQHRARSQRSEQHLSRDFHLDNPRIKIWLEQAITKGSHQSLYIHPPIPKPRSDYAYHVPKCRLTSYAEQEHPDDATFSIGVEIVAVRLSEVW